MKGGIGSVTDSSTKTGAGSDIVANASRTCVATEHQSGSPSNAGVGGHDGALTGRN